MIIIASLRSTMNNAESLHQFEKLPADVQEKILRLASVDNRDGFRGICYILKSLRFESDRLRRMALTAKQSKLLRRQRIYESLIPGKHELALNLWILNFVDDHLSQENLRWLLVEFARHGQLPEMQCLSEKHLRLTCLCFGTLIIESVRRGHTHNVQWMIQSHFKSCFNVALHQAYIFNTALYQAYRIGNVDIVQTILSYFDRALSSRKLIDLVLTSTVDFWNGPQLVNVAQAFWSDLSTDDDVLFIMSCKLKRRPERVVHLQKLDVIFIDAWQRRDIETLQLLTEWTTSSNAIQASVIVHRQFLQEIDQDNLTFLLSILSSQKWKPAFGRLIDNEYRFKLHIKSSCLPAAAKLLTTEFAVESMMSSLLDKTWLDLFVLLKTAELCTEKRHTLVLTPESIERAMRCTDWHHELPVDAKMVTACIAAGKLSKQTWHFFLQHFASRTVIKDSFLYSFSQLELDTCWQIFHSHFDCITKSFSTSCLRETIGDEPSGNWAWSCFLQKIWVFLDFELLSRGERAFVAALRENRPDKTSRILQKIPWMSHSFHQALLGAAEVLHHPEISLQLTTFERIRLDQETEPVSVPDFTLEQNEGPCID